MITLRTWSGLSYAEIAVVLGRAEASLRTAELVRKHFPLTPREIIQELDLRRPIYKATASYGHFGRTGDGFTWERTHRAEELRQAAVHASEVPVKAAK